MKYSEIYIKWTNFLKSKKLYGAFINDVGKLIVSKNKSQYDASMIDYYIRLDYNLLYKNSGCFTLVSLNLNDESDLRILVNYSLCLVNRTEGRSLIDWNKVYREYIKFTTQPILGKGLSRKARRANSTNKGRKYHYHDEQEIENIKWYNKFYEINAKNQFKNYRRR